MTAREFPAEDREQRELQLIDGAVYVIDATHRRQRLAARIEADEPAAPRRRAAETTSSRPVNR